MTWPFQNNLPASFMTNIIITEIMKRSFPILLYSTRWKILFPKNDKCRTISVLNQWVLSHSSELQVGIFYFYFILTEDKWWGINVIHLNFFLNFFSLVLCSFLFLHSFIYFTLEQNQSFWILRQNIIMWEHLVTLLFLKEYVYFYISKNDGWPCDRHQNSSITSF